MKKPNLRFVVGIPGLSLFWPAAAGADDWPTPRKRTVVSKDKKVRLTLTPKGTKTVAYTRTLHIRLSNGKFI